MESHSDQECRGSQ